MLDRILGRRRGPTAVDREANWRSNARARAERHGVAYEHVPRAEIWQVSGGRCHLCGRSWGAGDAWQPDHIVAVTRGGPNVLANLRVSCGGCNRRKSAKRRPPPRHIQNAAHTLAWYISARLCGAGQPVTPRAGVVDIIPAPQCYTVLLACDPRDLPRVLKPDTGEVLAAALGVAEPLAVIREGSRIAVQVPCAVRRVRLATMPARGGAFGMGINTRGRVLQVDLSKPETAHVFAVGGTGSGKTTLVQGIVAQLARANSPDALRIAGIDTKRELFTGPLATLPHLLYRPAETDEEAAAVVAAVTDELNRRIAGQERRPRILLVIDEAWDIDTTQLERIARMGRSYGVHIVAATQRGVAGDMAKSAAGQFGVRICGLLAPGDQWTAANIGVGDIYKSLTCTGDFAAYITRRQSGQAPVVRFMAAHEPEGSAYWTEGWPDPVDPPRVPAASKGKGQAGKATPAAPAVPDHDTILEMVRREYTGPLTANAIRLWSQARGITGPGRGIAYDRAKQLATALAGNTETAASLTH